MHGAHRGRARRDGRGTIIAAAAVVKGIVETGSLIHDHAAVAPVAETDAGAADERERRPCRALAQRVHAGLEAVTGEDRPFPDTYDPTGSPLDNLYELVLPALTLTTL